ncbi:putative orfan [Tupanvirus soda lake]|uniref:Orfan n=2 Tax=Tupanvirus TaxID=2094720 RepID=A0AC62AAY8_9VIRU|nr:putative orfan [Tupanvirus soda lake]QKU34815.1 putative orfan [Tupanvirus soda lake]
MSTSEASIATELTSSKSQSHMSKSLDGINLDNLPEFISSMVGVFRDKRFINDEIYENLDDDNLESVSVESNEITNKPQNNTNNLVYSIMEIMNNISKNKYKLIFELYSKIDTDESSETKINISKSATKIYEMLNCTKNEKEVLCKPEFRTELIIFYRYFKLYVSEQLDKQKMEINKIIEQIDTNPESFDINKILEEIAPKQN